MNCRIKAGQVDKLMKELLGNAKAARETEPGCLQFDVLVDPKDPAKLMLYEVYKDEAAFEAHQRRISSGTSSRASRCSSRGNTRFTGARRPDSHAPRQRRLPRRGARCPRDGFRGTMPLTVHWGGPDEITHVQLHPRRRSRPTSTRPSPRGWLRFWSSFLASNMQPVFATERQGTHRILAEVLINFDATVSRD